MANREIRDDRERFVRNVERARREERIEYWVINILLYLLFFGILLGLGWLVGLVLFGS